MGGGGGQKYEQDKQGKEHNFKRVRRKHFFKEGLYIEGSLFTGLSTYLFNLQYTENISVLHVFVLSRVRGSSLRFT